MPEIPESEVKIIAIMMLSTYRCFQRQLHELVLHGLDVCSILSIRLTVLPEVAIDFLPSCLVKSYKRYHAGHKTRLAFLHYYH